MEYLIKSIEGATKINILWPFEEYMFKAKKHIDLAMYNKHYTGRQ